jgi:O-antigen/teichoic acid export membrane protein
LNKFARSAATYLGGNALSAAIPFLLLPVLTRALTPADYGKVAMFTVVVSILNALTGLNVHGAIGVRFFQRDAAHFARYVAACLAILAVSTLAVALLVFVTGRWLEKIAEIPRMWLLLAVLTSAAQILMVMRLTLWQLRKQAARFAVLQVTQSLLNAGLSLSLVLLAAMAWRGRILGVAVAAICCAVLCLWWMRREVAGPIDVADARDALSFGVPLIPHSIGGLMIATTDRVLVANLLDIEQAGIYTVALQIGMVLGLLTEAFNRVYAPWLMAALRNPDAGLERRVVRGTYLYFAAVTVVALLLGLSSPLIMRLLAGPNYADAAEPVLYIALGFAFSGMYYMVTNYIFYASRTGRLALITISAGMFNIGATFLLIRSFGLVGAAQGFMLSQAVLFLGTWWLAHRVRPMPWRSALRRVTV